ncbi:MAG TPA: DUF4397 domain-containing protein [Gaiellaceae bacterium]|nr:DUF4397 domain-containing protein [Gaiellaceae bacterium]
MKVVTFLAAAAAALVATFGAAAQANAASVTVLHGVPGLTVDVYVNGELTLESFEPGTVTDPLELPAGDYDIEIREAGAAADSDPAITGSASVEDTTNASIVAHLDEGGAPTLSVFVNDVSQIAAGESRVTVRHTAAAPTVDVLADGSPLIEGLANPDEAGADVPAGTYSVAVAPAGTTDAVLGPTDLALEAGTAYFVYAIGSAEEESLDLLVQTVSGLGAAPAGAPAGNSGLAAEEAFPVWLAALLVLGAAGLAGSGVALARARNRA